MKTARLLETLTLVKKPPRLVARILEADAGTGEGEGADPGAENPEDGDGKEPESDQGLPEVVCPLPAGRYVVLSALAGDAALDIDGASAVDAANAQLWTYNQSGAQMFDVSVNEKGWCTIACAASGKVLDVAWGQDVAGANVHQYEKKRFECSALEDRASCGWIV